jgi:Tol biopolymer transport system component
MKKLFLAVFALLLFLNAAQAQYFGRNKPRYRDFTFQVARTNHFDIHYYLKNREVVQRFANWSEDWYLMHQSLFNDTIKFKNPIILYNNHADFQQTNTIDGEISVGTGGVTEAFKNRVVLPLTHTNQQTYHVLGHELVHAFQYNLVINRDSTSLRNLANLPLWMVEGLAEYMSIGRFDAHTSMWMRDAVLNNDVPNLNAMTTNFKYFPYRYGQAFWAYATARYGDKIIEPLFTNTAKYGLEKAFLITLGTSTKAFSEDWKKTLTDYYTPFFKERKEKPQGVALINDKNGGNMNVSPVISPNGKYVIFLSEKNLLSTDLFLADAQTGAIIRTIAGQAKDGHLDDFNNLESAGTWSPDSKQFAFVGVKKGQNVLVVKDVMTGKTVMETAIKGVPAFTQPAWSSVDKNKMVVAGLVEGQTDLFELDLKTRKVKQLTNDVFSEIQPHFAPDGNRLVFSTDEKSFSNGKNRGRWTFNLAILNLQNGDVEHLNIFDKADNLNPVMDEKGDIYFLSDRDGFRNIYRYEVSTNKIYQITDLLTGATGITQYSPAISIERSQSRTRMVYAHYFNHKYTIYKASTDDFLNKEVDRTEVYFNASMLPSVPSQGDLVSHKLFLSGRNTQEALVRNTPYRPKFKLDYVGGGVGAGVNMGNTFQQGAGLAGGVQTLFSDMLGNHQLFSTVALNGEIFDFGGQAMYINRTKRLAWGVSLGRIPFQTGGYGYNGRDTLNFRNIDGGIEVDKYTLRMQRIYDNSVSAFAQFPLSTTRRLEAGVGYNAISFRVDDYNDYIDPRDPFQQIIYQDRERQPAPPGFGFFTANAAFVGDNSIMGLTSPLSGWRYRLGVEQYLGTFNYTANTVDVRLYQRANPFTFALRAMHYGRHGNRANDLNPLYAGQFFFMHGYDFNQLQNTFGDSYGNQIGRMVGNQIGVMNAEIRIPLTGPKRLALIPFQFLPTELNFFADAGVAFNRFGDFGLADSNLRPLPLASVGVGLRVNLFGYLILEPYLARPIVEGSTGRWNFGLNIIPGW